MNIHVLYFAILREQAGMEKEIFVTDAANPSELYNQLKERFSFSMDPSKLKVAINEQFSDWQTPLSDGDTVAFLTPVAGG